MSSNGNLPNSTIVRRLNNLHTLRKCKKRKGDAIWNRHWSIEKREKDWKELQKQNDCLPLRIRKDCTLFAELRGRDTRALPRIFKLF